MSSAPASAEAISALEQYTACDVSDALLKLKVPGAGFIADLAQYSPQRPAGSNNEGKVTVAPVSTVLFTAKDEDPATASTRPAPNFPKDTHWVDNAVPGTFAVMQQPPGQTNAICGGIMALRMKVLGVKGIIVAGRVRDLVELQSTELPVRAFLSACFFSPKRNNGQPCDEGMMQILMRHDRYGRWAPPLWDPAGAAPPGRERFL